VVASNDERIARDAPGDARFIGGSDRVKDTLPADDGSEPAILTTRLPDLAARR
jgi:hypothetical protein